MDKMFLYYEPISASFTTGNICVWYISTLICSYSFNDGKLKWSFFSGHIYISFDIIFSRNNTGKIKTSFYPHLDNLICVTPTTSSMLVCNLFCFRSKGELYTIMVPSFERIWKLMWIEYIFQSVINCVVFWLYESIHRKTNFIAFFYPALVQC